MTPDDKMRWGGWLEVPWISRIQRAALDAGRVQGLRRALDDLSCSSVLEVGCGLGECSAAVRADRYCGLDNSPSRVRFASNRFPQHRFVTGDALNLPFASHSFDLVMLIDTSHHLTSEEFRFTLAEMVRVSRKYVVVSDPVLNVRMNPVRSFFYRLDRGRCFRTPDLMRTLMESRPDLKILQTPAYRTFPGIYKRVSFIGKISCQAEKASI